MLYLFTWTRLSAKALQKSFSVSTGLPSLINCWCCIRYLAASAWVSPVVSEGGVGQVQWALCFYCILSQVLKFRFSFHLLLSPWRTQLWALFSNARGIMDSICWSLWPYTEGKGESRSQANRHPLTLHCHFDHKKKTAAGLELYGEK